MFLAVLPRFTNGDKNISIVGKSGDTISLQCSIPYQEASSTKITFFAMNDNGKYQRIKSYRGQ